MKAGKEKLGAYSPKMIFAGDFPVTADNGTAATEIKEMMPVTLTADGKLSAVTKETVADVYGLAAEDAKKDEEVVFYVTGQFFTKNLALPTGVTVADIKAPLRKVSIFLVGEA